MNTQPEVNADHEREKAYRGSKKHPISVWVSTISAFPNPFRFVDQNNTPNRPTKHAAKHQNRGQIPVHKQMRDSPSFDSCEHWCRIRPLMRPLVTDIQKYHSKDHQKIVDMGENAGGVHSVMTGAARTQ